jgi:hypothetical protein
VPTNFHYGDGVSPALDTLRATYVTRLRALVDSLGTSDHYADGVHRIVTRVAQQIGETRRVLTTDARPEFDRRAKVWITERAAEGSPVTIPGLSS